MSSKNYFCSRTLHTAQKCAMLLQHRPCALMIHLRTTSQDALTHCLRVARNEEQEVVLHHSSILVAMQRRTRGSDLSPIRRVYSTHKRAPQRRRESKRNHTSKLLRSLWKPRDQIRNRSSRRIPSSPSSPRMSARSPLSRTSFSQIPTFSYRLHHVISNSIYLEKCTHFEYIM